MEVLEYSTVDIPSYTNPPDEPNECIECTVLERKDVEMDSLRRQYLSIKESLRCNRPVPVSIYNNLMIELCRIENEVNRIERVASTLFQKPSCDKEVEYDLKGRILTAVVEDVSSHSSNESHFNYQVKTPHPEIEDNCIEEEIKTLRSSISSLQSMLTILEEQGDNHSLASLLSYMEHVVSILNPSFLHRLESDYASVLRQYIRFLDKRRGDKFEKTNRLENVYNMANSLSTNIKEVDRLLLILRNQKMRIQKWDELVMKVEDLEKKQNACIQVLKDDQQILKDLDASLNNAFDQLKKNMEYISHKH